MQKVDANVNNNLVSYFERAHNLDILHYKAMKLKKSFNFSTHTSEQNIRVNEEFMEVLCKVYLKKE